MQIVNRLSATPLPRRPNFFAERGKNGSCARRAAFRRRTFRPNEPAARAAAPNETPASKKPPHRGGMIIKTSAGKTMFLRCGRENEVTPSAPTGHRLARWKPRSVRKRHGLCAVSKFAGGKEPTGLFASMHLLTLGEGGKGMNNALASQITSARRVPLRFVAAEQISQAAAFLAALPQCSLLLFPKISLTRFFWEPFLLNYFCKQGCLAQQAPICLILEAYCT